jgi:hypothetical protein
MRYAWSPLGESSRATVGASILQAHDESNLMASLRQGAADEQGRAQDLMRRFEGDAGAGLA